MSKLTKQETKEQTQQKQQRKSENYKGICEIPIYLTNWKI